MTQDTVWVMGMKDGVLVTLAHHTSKSTAGPAEHRKLDGETWTRRAGDPSATGMHITSTLGQTEAQLTMWDMW